MYFQVWFSIVLFMFDINRENLTLGGVLCLFICVSVFLEFDFSSVSQDPKNKV